VCNVQCSLSVGPRIETFRIYVYIVLFAVFTRGGMGFAAGHVSTLLRVVDFYFAHCVCRASIKLPKKPFPVTSDT
jgi:hypothetical protein